MITYAYERVSTKDQNLERQDNEQVEVVFKELDRLGRNAEDWYRNFCKMNTNMLY